MKNVNLVRREDFTTVTQAKESPVTAGPELTLEQQILTELSDIKDGQIFMRVTLLGGTYRDVPHDGKLPLQDRVIELLQKHILALLRRKILSPCQIRLSAFACK